jgi:ABC-2 type transport system ATP-binding protein
VRSLAQTDLADALTRRGALIQSSPDGAMVVTGLDSTAIGGVAATHGITLVELAANEASLEQAFFELTRNETDYHGGLLAGATQGA